MQLVIDEERVIKVDGVALQGLGGLHRPGSGAAPACRAHPPGALAHARRADHPRADAGWAPMPAGRRCRLGADAGWGHFGPELRRFVLLQYQGQVTMPRLVGQLRAIGIVISKRQVGSTRTPAPSSRTPCCGPGWKRRPGSASMTPAPATGTATAHKLATITSPPSPPRRAG